MSTQNWVEVNKVHFIHGIDFAEGLDLQGEFCYAMELTGGNAFVAIKNNIVTNKSDVKIRATLRKSCSKIEPFLFVRATDGDPYDPYAQNGDAYVLKMENNLNLYKLNLLDPVSIASTAPLVSGLTPLSPNVSYRLSFFIYTLLDGSAVFEVDILNGTTWINEIKQVLTPDISSGNVGFGAYYPFATIQPGCKRVFIDEIEISTPVTFI